MFEDRFDAGKQLGIKLKKYQEECMLVISLPRGGVAVGFPVAQTLHIPLEVIIVRKISSPFNEEFGVGAMAEEGVIYKDNGMLEMLQIPPDILSSIQKQATEEVERRKLLYRGEKPLPLLTNKTVILVDDGLATGVTAKAAILAIKRHHPKKIIFAVPVCSAQTAEILKPLIDKIICLGVPPQLETIGKYYHDFRQVTDEEVIHLLKKANNPNTIIISEENEFTHKIVW